MKTIAKKLLKIPLYILIFIVAAVLVTSAVRYGTKVRTFNYVKNNTEILTSEAQKIIDEGVSAHYEFDGHKVSYSTAARHPVVEFSTGGYGIAPSGFYTGFYYSPEDIPIRYNGSGIAVAPHKKGWIYQEKGDNHGYTEKICHNWYWYKFWF